MSKKLVGAVAAAAGVVMLGASAASADALWNGGSGDSGFGNATDVWGPQNALAITNGPLVDANCAAAWSNGAVLGVTFAPGSHYAACNTDKVDQGNFDSIG